MLLQQQWSGASTACVSPPIWQLEPLVPREEGKNKFKSTKNCVTVLAIRKHKGHVVFGLFAVHVTAHLLSSKEKKQVDLQNMGRNIEVFWESCLDYCLFSWKKTRGWLNHTFKNESWSRLILPTSLGWYFSAACAGSYFAFESQPDSNNSI